MVKKLRKYQRTMMVAFGVLLLLTWLAGPAVERLGKAAGNRKYGSIDGHAVYQLDQLNASKEARAFTEIGRQIGFFDVLDEHDAMQWMLLRQEAQGAGLVAEAENGPEMLDRAASGIARDMVLNVDQRLRSGQMGQNDINIYMRLQQAKTPEERRAMQEQMVGQFTDMIKSIVNGAFAGAHLNSEEAKVALARFFGIRRMQRLYVESPRVSDRAAIQEARTLSDGAFVDYVTIPASAGAAAVADPGDAALQAQFDAYKTVKPGEGEYGIGYLLGPRVKLEYLKLDRKAIEAAIPLDPVEVYKRWSTSRGVYTGEFPAERPKVEADIRREGADKVMREASSAFQREVQKLTRRLESDGRYKVLPADWDSARPRLAGIAAALVEQVRLGTGLTMPEPVVVVSDRSWSERDALGAMKDIGASSFQQGGIRASFPDVVFWARELSGNGPVAVQAGVPVADAYLQGYGGDRFYFNLLAVRQESAPDSMGEVREQVLKDYQAIQAFQALKARTDEFRTRAQSPDGLSAIAAEFPTTPEADPAKPQETPKPEPLPVRRDVKVTSALAGDPVLTEDVRKAVVTAAHEIDPLTPLAQIPPEKAAWAVAVPKHLSVVVGKITRPAPLTIDEYRQNDAGYAARRRAEDLQSVKAEPFSLASLLARHVVTVGDRRISTPADLRSDRED
jgi:hypothetical protein